MSHSVLLRGAEIVDGSGQPRFEGDVRVESGVIAEVGKRLEPEGHDVVELAGLILCPGFIDVHTHYDAQILWDPDLTPSSWHGVTTVVMGNCGFSIAPTRRADREVIARTLENVEGMSLEALTQGIRWEFESFGEYLQLIDEIPKKINVAGMVGHSALRLYVLGEKAAEQEATPGEVELMCAELGRALDAGAIGFATSRSAAHVGAWGKPVPSRNAALDEVESLMRVLDQRGAGTVQISTGTSLEELRHLGAAVRRPITWTALLTGRYLPLTAVDMVDQSANIGGEIYPQMTCRPLVMQVTLEDPQPMAHLPCIQEVLAVPHADRPRVYADEAWRRGAREEFRNDWAARWPKMFVDETECHQEIRGESIAALSVKWDRDPFDVMVDLALAEELRTRFLVVLRNDDEAELAELLQDKRTLLGLSDAGAHASQLCDAGYCTYLLGHWCRELEVLDLETAVWRLTAQPASIFDVGKRGRIASGMVADLVAFDPVTVGTGPKERVWDLPAGADRLITKSTGVEYVMVAGEWIRKEDQEVPEAHPGRLLRLAGASGGAGT